MLQMNIHTKIGGCMTSRLLQRIFGATLLALLSVAMLPTQGWSQGRGGVEVGGTYSFMWCGSFDLYEGEIVMEDNPSYGGMIDIPVQRNTMVELSYSYTSSRATFSPYYPGSPTTPELENLDNPVSVQYFQVGALYQITKGEVAQPFFGMHMGAVLFSPSGTAQGLSLDDQWNFTISFSGGVKLYMSEKFGVRLQGRLLMPMYFSGGGMYVGTGGAGFSVGAGIPIVQGDLGVGVFLRF
jgi:hypothetical protein